MAVIAATRLDMDRCTSGALDEPAAHQIRRVLAGRGEKIHRKIVLKTGLYAKDRFCRIGDKSIAMDKSMPH